MLRAQKDVALHVLKQAVQHKVSIRRSDVDSSAGGSAAQKLGKSRGMHEEERRRQLLGKLAVGFKRAKASKKDLLATAAPGDAPVLLSSSLPAAPSSSSLSLHGASDLDGSGAAATAETSGASSAAAPHLGATGETMVHRANSLPVMPEKEPEQNRTDSTGPAPSEDAANHHLHRFRRLFGFANRHHRTSPSRSDTAAPSSNGAPMIPEGNNSGRASVDDVDEESVQLGSRPVSAAGDARRGSPSPPLTPISPLALPSQHVAAPVDSGIGPFVRPVPMVSESMLSEEEPVSVVVPDTPATPAGNAAITTSTPISAASTGSRSGYFYEAVV